MSAPRSTGDISTFTLVFPVGHCIGIPPTPDRAQEISISWKRGFRGPKNPHFPSAWKKGVFCPFFPVFPCRKKGPFTENSLFQAFSKNGGFFDPGTLFSRKWGSLEPGLGSGESQFHCITSESEAAMTSPFQSSKAEPLLSEFGSSMTIH